MSIQSTISKLTSPTVTGQGWSKVPMTDEQKSALTFLSGLYGGGAMDFPTRSVSGLTATEQRAQSLLGDYLNTSTPSGLMAAETGLMRTVQGGYDPFTSPEYRSYREASALEEADAVNAMRRRAQLGGIGSSSPQLASEGRTRRGYSADRLGYLASLFSRERDRATAAAPVLADISMARAEYPARQAQAGATLGAIPRTVADAQQAAVWEKLMSDLLAPYQYQAPVAGNILGEAFYAYNPGFAGPSQLQQGVDLANAVANLGMAFSPSLAKGSLASPSAAPTAGGIGYTNSSTYPGQSMFGQFAGF